MRKLMAAVAALVVLAGSALSASAAPGSGRSNRGVERRASLADFRPAAVPGEVIVRFRKGATRTAATRTASAAGAKVVAGPVARFGVMAARPGLSAAAVIASLETDPGVAWAEPNLLRFVSAVPNDPGFAGQWGMNNAGQSHPTSGSTSTRSGTSDADIDAVEAWDVQQGNSETVIAVMDSGVDVAHPDLAANLWVNDGEIAGNGIDDDNNGYRDDINGWDFGDGDAGLLASSAFEGWEHGTHVAGIISATANNGIGGSGVCPACKLMVLKTFTPVDTDGDGADDTMAGDIAAELKAFDYAIANGADVINGSFGGSIVASRAERAAIADGIAAGITMVFAAGNENGDNDLLIPGLDFDEDDVVDSTSPSYPASHDLDGIISVAASNDSDENAYGSQCFVVELTRGWPCTFTNWGRESVDLSAPGVDIVSTLPNNTYAAFDGTSMATPYVAGVAGLVLAAHPDYTPAQVANAIMNSVDRPSSLRSLGAFPGGSPAVGDFTVTSGRLNAAAALSASTVDNFPVTDGNISGARRLRGTVLDSVSWPQDTNDVFKKSLTRGVRYKAILNTSGAADLDLQIYKPGTAEIWPLDGRCFGGSGCPVLFLRLLFQGDASGDVTRRFRAGKSGTYFFHVNAWLFNQGNYSLKVARL